MKLQCPGCQVSFTIPDEKIPQGKGLRILCPKCRIPISLKSPGGCTSEVALIDQLISPGIEEFSILDDKSLLDVVEEGVKTALVCVSSGRSDLVGSVLRELDYFTVSASKGPYAVAKVQNNHYDVIILEEDFDAENGNQDILLHHLQLLPMHTRREFFLCLLTHELPTLDHMSAFRKGVNMTLNIRDQDKMKILLARILKEHHIFYKSFREELARKG